MPVLQVLQDDELLFSVPLRAHRTLVGRSDACDVALPSDTVSRVHCHVERDGEGIWLVDRSRHGTFVAGERVERRLLSAGESFAVGRYRLRLVADHVSSGATTRLVGPADWEELVAAPGAVGAVRLFLRVGRAGDGGGQQGAGGAGGALGASRRVPLTRSRTRLGGQGAHVRLDDALPAEAAALRVVRARAMVEPGAVPVFLDGQRVRALTPFFPGETLRLGDHALTLGSEVVEATEEPLSFGALVGSSAPMRAVYRMLSRVAAHEAPVLLLGASGTGKELAAAALHDASPRAEGPFVALNGAAIPPDLVESELFGHEAGAFTGAVRRRDGAFQRAHKGTLFLDEVGELSLEAQAKLLRALESGEVRRVGGDGPEHPDVRVVAATHRNLLRMVREGRFREDLFYRLAVLTVRLPSLAERKEDLPQLVAALLARHHPGAVVSEEALVALAAHDWPGNVRELRNVLTRAVVLGGPSVDVGDLQLNPWAFDEPSDEPLERADAEASEAARIQWAMQEARGVRAEAARLLGIPRTSLLYKLRKHGLIA